MIASPYLRSYYKSPNCLNISFKVFFAVIIGAGMLSCELASEGFVHLCVVRESWGTVKKNEMQGAMLGKQVGEELSKSN